MTANEILRAAVSFDGVGASVAQMVFWWILTSGTTPDADIVTETVAWLVANVLDDWSEIASTAATASLVELDIINTDGTVNRNIGTEPIDVDGQATGGQNPAGAAGFVFADTLVAKTRGRKYLPFIAEDVISGGLLTAGALADLALFFAAYVSPIDVSGPGFLNPGVLSRTLNQFVAFRGGGGVTDVPAYQRRRKPGVGS